MAWTQPPQAATTQLAGWWRRVGATIIDGLIIGIPSYIIGLAGGTAVRYIIQIALTLAYTAYLLGNRGQTVGMMAVGTRCVDSTSGQYISVGRALGRTVLEEVLGITVIGGILDILWPLWDKQNQTLHDKAVGSLIIMVNPTVSDTPYPASYGQQGGYQPGGYQQGGYQQGAPGGWGGQANPPGEWGTTPPPAPAPPPAPPAPPVAPPPPPAAPSAAGGWGEQSSGPPAGGGFGSADAAPQAGGQSGAANPVAGWYPDPADASQQRWWDGKGWSDQTRAG